MNSLYALGDLHFSLTKSWHREVFGKFIDWFENYDFGKKEESELIQLGDVFDKASNYGDTLEIAAQFFNICCKKFKTIYILTGNHDLKMEKNATKFLSFISYEDNQIMIINKESIFKTQLGFNIIALPHIRLDSKILDDYYSNDLPKEFYTTKADLLCGHVAIKEPKTFYGGIDITKFATSNKAFGHIHIRNGTYKDIYTGSVLPNKIDEVNSEVRLIKSNNKDIEIPEFIKYENLEFGKDPKRYKDGLTRIYTISNCKNIQQAKTQYPQLYIRGVDNIKNNIDVKTGEKSITFIHPLSALENMITETKMVLKRKTLLLLRNLLK